MSTPELLRGEGLPRFEVIDAEQVNSEIPTLLTALNSQLEALESVSYTHLTLPTTD